MKKQTSRELSWEFEVVHPHTLLALGRKAFKNAISSGLCVKLLFWLKAQIGLLGITGYASEHGGQYSDLRQNSLLGGAEIHWLCISAAKESWEHLIKI